MDWFVFVGRAVQVSIMLPKKGIAIFALILDNMYTQNAGVN